MRKILLVFLLMMVSPANVAASECGLSVSPGTVLQNTFTDFNFTVSNTSTSDVYKWVKISIVSEDIDLNNPNSSNWTAGGDRSQGTFTSADGIAAGQSNGYIFSESGVGIAPANVEVTVAVSASEDGSEASNCATTSISLVAELSSAPVISDINLTVGNSSASLSWNTDVAATGVVNFGTTSGYGSNVTTSSGTTHSVTMNDLSASTTYHYQIQVTGTGGTTSTADATFTTAAASVSTTTTTTVTNTVTNTATVSKTVILADTTKPTVSVSTKLDKTYAEAPIVQGKVVDTGVVNVGIVKIQYSVDKGASWLLVDEPSGASKSDFSFVPEVYEDGNYHILVRAIDRSGNIGVSSEQILIIDRLPPGIIHSLWRVGPLILSAPYPLIPGIPVQITMQAVGGVTELSIEIQNQKYEMVKNFETGLWEGEINVQRDSIPVSQYPSIPVMVRAADGGGNKIEEELGEIEIQRFSEISNSASLPAQAGQQASLSVYRYDELTKRFKVWNGEVYGQDNPSTGKSSWYLPPGRYYISAKATGYLTGESMIFELNGANVVSIENALIKRNIWNFWKRSVLQLNKAQTAAKADSGLVGRQMTWIEKTDWRGKEINLAILPIWEPRLAEILHQTSKETIVVIVGANKSSVLQLKNRGGYKQEFVADPDGEIVSDLKNTILPALISVNRRGQVEGVE